jgi:hypothetical protein
MALIHYLYVGHFVPDDSFVRFQEMRPVAERPINMATVHMLIRRYTGSDVPLESLPEEWAMTIGTDYIVCNRNGSSLAALGLAADYAMLERAYIVDLGCYQLVDPKQLKDEVAVGQGLARQTA